MNNLNPCKIQGVTPQKHIKLITKWNKCLPVGNQYVICTSPTKGILIKLSIEQEEKEKWGKSSNNQLKKIYGVNQGKKKRVTMDLTK